MASSPDQYQLLHTRKIEIINNLTELNSRHIKSEGQLGGIEFELTRCREAIEAGAASADFDGEVNRLENAYLELTKVRENIDLERETLNSQMQEIDRQLAALG